MKSIEKKKWLKWIVTTCSVLLVVVAAFVGYSYFFSEEEQVAAAQSTATVQTGNLEVKVSGSGSIQPAAKESIKATLSALNCLATAQHEYSLRNRWSNRLLLSQLTDLL